MTLLFTLLMFCLGLAPFAELFELDFSLHKLAVFSAPVIDALTLRAGEFYELFLRHNVSAESIL